MTREEMWKEFENQLIGETRTPVTMSYDDAEILIKLGIKETVAKWKRRLEQTRWVPVSEKLPKENEYIGDVCKYYLIQDEYGDMHVAHLSNVGWIPMDSLKAIGNEVTAWMPLPEPYSKEKEETLREKLEGEERGLG